MKKILRIFKNLVYSISSLKKTISVSNTRNRYKLLYEISTNSGISDAKINGIEVIVSLTSYGKKLDECYLTIESLFHQTYKPNKIILWLDQNIYSEEHNIPYSLIEQKKRGLDIRLCKDVRSHTKLVPALINFPNDIIITVDDDMLYPIYFVEKLVKSYLKDPTKIYFYRGHTMLFKKNGEPASYINWVKKGSSGCSIYNFPTGVGGILYPPDSLSPEVTNENIFLDLCPYADDVWFKIMSYINGVECQKIELNNYEEDFIPLEIDENLSLQKKNVIYGGNDLQIKKLFDFFNIHA